MEVPNNQKIDRCPEKLFNIENVDQCPLLDINSKRTCFYNIRKGYTVIVIFLRHFLDYSTKEYAEDFAKICTHNLNEANVKVIFIGLAASKYIRKFKEDTKFPYEIYCDSRRRIYKELEFYDSPVEQAGSKKSVHVKSTPFYGFCKTVWNTFKSQDYQGDPFQQGGQAIISRNDEILYFHRDRNQMDHTPINKLLDIVGLPLADFSDRYKVKNI